MGCRTLVWFSFEFQVNAHGALLVGGVVALVVPRGAEGAGRSVSWVTVVAVPVLSSLVFGRVIRRSNDVLNGWHGYTGMKTGGREAARCYGWLGAEPPPGGTE